MQHVTFACHAYAMSMNLSAICLSVTLVDCDHIVQENVEKVYCRIAICMRKSNWMNILCDPKFYWGRPVRYGKMWSFASNSSHVTLSQHLLSILLIQDKGSEACHSHWMFFIQNFHCQFWMCFRFWLRLSLLPVYGEKWELLLKLDT